MMKLFTFQPARSSKIVWNSRRVILVSSICAGLVGCSLEEDTLQQALDKAQRVTAQQKTLFTSIKTDSSSPHLQQDGVLGEMLEVESEVAPTVVEVPYPDRTNPFEFGAGVDFDAPQSRQNETLQIKLYGFIGDESPKAILNVDGRTKTLGAGEKWGVLEVMDIRPPMVRIKTNGVVRIWSILGNQQQPGTP